MHDLIALSGKQFAGKDEVADLLVKHLPGFVKAPIARGIKVEFANLYGLSPNEVEANKALYRPSLILIGQRRRAIDPDYFLKQVFEISGAKIVSDMRLKREYDLLKEKGAFCIRVEAPRSIREQRGTLVKEDDLTECDLDDVSAWDAVIQNDGDLAHLESQVLAIIQQL